MAMEWNSPLLLTALYAPATACSFQLHLGQGYVANKGITELGLVRKGEIEKAANLLATRSPYQWTSLPGGTEEKKYSVSEMMSNYEKLLAELTIR